MDCGEGFVPSCGGRFKANSSIKSLEKDVVEIKETTKIAQEDIKKILHRLQTTRTVAYPGSPLKPQMPRVSGPRTKRLTRSSSKNSSTYSITES